MTVTPPHILRIPPTEYPVTLADVKRYDGREHDDDDRLLNDLIQDATDYAQKYLQLQLCSATYEVFFDSFSDCLPFPLLPVVSVDSIKYYDADDMEQLLDPAIYEVMPIGWAPQITLKEGQSWPTTATRWDAVKVLYVAGHGAAEDVPGALKRALLMLVRHWDENREGVAFTNTMETPHSVSNMLDRFRRHQGA